MARLNQRLEASSLLECIVAAVILLACFAITMEMLTRVTLTGNDPAESVTVELTLRQCHREYGDGLHATGEYTKAYEWGKIEINITDYTGNLQRLTLTAYPAKGVKVVKYDYLVKIRL